MPLAFAAGQLVRTVAGPATDQLRLGQLDLADLPDLEVPGDPAVLVGLADLVEVEDQPVLQAVLAPGRQQRQETLVSMVVLALPALQALLADQLRLPGLAQRSVTRAVLLPSTPPARE